MDEYNYTELFRLQSTELTGKTPFCPEDQQIAEYFDETLGDAERTVLEHHLTNCRFCQARIGVLDRLAENIEERRIPEGILATAKQMAPSSRARQWRLAPAMATAAVIVLALFTVVNRNQGQIPDPESGPTALSSPELNATRLRSINSGVINLNVLMPAPGADIDPGSLMQWDAIPGNLHYNIYVLSDIGDVLWTERLAGTSWELDESLKLAANSQFYFRVEAVLADGRTVSSKHVSFGVVEHK